MGYSGFSQNICEVEHYWEADSDTACPVCGKRIKYQKEVDDTNGFEQEGYAYSFKAPIVSAGYEDKWSLDKNGNKYIEKIPLFRPLNVVEDIYAGWVDYISYMAKLCEALTVKESN